MVGSPEGFYKEIFGVTLETISWEITEKTTRWETHGEAARDIK